MLAFDRSTAFVPRARSSLPHRTHFATVNDMLRVWSDQTPDSLAFRFLPPSPRAPAHDLTYRELWRLADRAAMALTERGMRSNDRMVIVLPTGPEDVSKNCPANQKRGGGPGDWVTREQRRQSY